MLSHLRAVGPLSKCLPYARQFSVSSARLKAPERDLMTGEQTGLPDMQVRRAHGGKRYTF